MDNENSIKTYSSITPKADKILKQDGSIVTSTGEVIMPPDPARAKQYASMSPQAAKFLLPDGSVTDSVEEDANHYVHPEFHPPSIIQQDENNRFVTDTEKESWNNAKSIPFEKTTGTNTAYLFATADVDSYTDGLPIVAQLHLANGDNATINVNNKGAKPIFYSDESKLKAGDYVANAILTLRFSTANNGFFVQGGKASSGGSSEAVVQFENYTPPDFTGHTTLKSLSVARDQAAIATNGDGCVLICGGYASAASAVVEKYNTSGERSTLSALSTARYNSAAAPDGEGSVWIGGGRINSTTYSDVVNKYTLSGTRTTETPLSVPRTNLSATPVGDGDVLFVGGIATGGIYSGIVDRYTPSGTRTTIGSLSVGRINFVALTTPEGYAYFISGSTGGANFTDTVEVCDPDGNITSSDPLSAGRAFFAGAINGLGNPVVGGGMIAGALRTAVVETIDRHTGIVTVLSPLSVARHSPSAASDTDGNVYFAGGTPSSGYSDVVDKYTPSGTRTTLQPLATARADIRGARLGEDKVIFVGGSTTYRSDVVDVYSSRAYVAAPIGSKYAFNGEPEQTSSKPDISVTVPMTGYIKYKSGTIT